MNDDLRLLASNKPLDLLRRYIKGGMPAMRWYIQALQERFSPQLACHDLTNTSNDPTRKILKITWRALVAPKPRIGALEIAMLFLGHVGLKVQHTILEATTYHAPFGNSSAQAMVIRWRLVQVLYGVSFFFFLMGLLCTVLVAGFWYGEVHSLPGEDHRKFLAIFAGCLSVFVVGMLGVIYVHRYALPKELRFIPRYPLYLHNIAAISTIQALSEPSMNPQK